MPVHSGSNNLCMHKIDLNCDMGEGMVTDEAIMPWISSANIACGYHAGDEITMERTIELAIRHKVAIGAHVSYADRENFGRSEVHLSAQKIYELVREQLELFFKLVSKRKKVIAHIKPHGALYNMAARDAEMAKAIAAATFDFDRNMILYGLSGSELIRQAEAIGLKTCSEVFADRRYEDDGSLTSRSRKDALIEKEDDAAEQVLQMIGEGHVRSINGIKVPIKAETICVHGDGANAAKFARRIHEVLKINKVKIVAPLRT